MLIIFNKYYKPFFIKVKCLLFIIYLTFSVKIIPNSILICIFEGFNIWQRISDATYISILNISKFTFGIQLLMLLCFLSSNIIKFILIMMFFEIWLLKILYAMAQSIIQAILIQFFYYWNFQKHFSYFEELDWYFHEYLLIILKMFHFF